MSQQKTDLLISAVHFQVTVLKVEEGMLENTFTVIY